MAYQLISTMLTFSGKAGTGMDREVSITLKHGAEAKDYNEVSSFMTNLMMVVINN